MSNDQEAREAVWDVFLQAIFDSRLWKGAEPLDIRVVHLAGFVALYILSKLSFDWSIDWVQRAESSRYIGLVLFGLSVMCWLGGSLILLKTIWQLGLQRLVLFLGVGIIVLAIAIALLSDSDQSLDQDIMSTAETILSRAAHYLVQEIIKSQVQAPREFQRVYTAARPTPLPAKDVTSITIPTPDITRESTHLLTNIKSTVTPGGSFSVLKATPKSVASDGAPLAIDFLIDGIESDQHSIRLNITIKRRASTSLAWTSDEGRKTEIYLTADSQRYDLLEMGGIFVQNTTLQPKKLYKGWFTFEKPRQGTFTLYYPDIEPLQIESSF